uniref:sodium:calcium antiporter n=1 Tax=Oceanobacillus halotolerans TaxID=2663380 RepID=UPI0013DD1C21|nr:sodium:calcium antiporter [Oceanobacillus halotolerans]
MVFIYFILAAVVTVYSARKLSQFADIISEKTAMGGMLVGTVLLAGATSLPEVTTSFSAVIIGNPDIAIGNMLGSNLFNFFILASFDLYFRRKQLFHLGSGSHLHSATLGLILTLLVTLALLLRIDFIIFGIGIDALIIAAVYVFGMFIISKLPAPPVDENAIKADTSVIKKKESSVTAKGAIIGFIIAAIVIMGAGTVLSIMGDKIALVTGMGSSFVGSFLIAATTSLPEAVSVFIALRLKNVNLAIGSILGSNMFNMLILAISDIVYRGGSILAEVSGSHIFTSIGILIMSLVVMVALGRKQSESVLRYIMPSLIIFLGYFIVSYIIFVG